MPEKIIFQEKMAKENMHIMPVLEVIDKRKIDIFDYNSINSDFLLEGIRKYGKQIY